MSEVPSMMAVVPNWVWELTGDDLVKLCGAASVRGGAAYQSVGAVRDMETDLEHGLSAAVIGSRRYRTCVWWEPYDEGAPLDVDEVFGECTCPVGVDCKHVAALILQAQAAAPAAYHRTRPTPAAAPTTWESLLAPVVAAAKARTTASSPETPLALLIETRPGYPRSGSRPTLTMRPLMRGSSGAWIRTGISWSDLQYAHSQPGLDGGQRKALTAIVRAHRATSQTWYASGDWIGLDSLGDDVWRLLEQAAAAGAALVTGGRGQSRVQLLPDPVEVEIDATRGPEQQILLRPTLTLPNATGTPVTIGSPAHGLFATAGDGLVLARLAHPLTEQMGTLLNGVDVLTVPAADTGRFLTGFYPVLRRQAKVRSSDDSVSFPEVQPPRLGLEIRFEPDHLTRLHWTFRYAVGQQVHELPLRPQPPADPFTLASRGINLPEPEAVVRDPAREQALLASLGVLDGVPGLRAPAPGMPVPVSGGPRPDVAEDAVLEGWATVRFVTDILPALQAREDIDVRLVGEALPYAQADEPPLVSVSTRDPHEDMLTGPDGAEDDTHGWLDGSEQPQQDWFDLGIDVSVAGRSVPLGTLLTALGRGEEQLVLPDGTWFCLDAVELHTLRRLVEEARALQDRPSEGLRINRYQAGLWEELVSLGVVAEQSARWERTVGALLALDELPQPEPPAGLEATLRSYQLDGYRWLSFLWEHELGGILADDMGLGKTVQTLAAAERAREQGRLTPERPLLVVAPTSVVATWQREAARFTPHLRVAALTQTVHRSRQPLEASIAGAHVVVTSYALLRIDEEHLTGRVWSAVVLDEAQMVKNHQSRTYQVARSLRAPVKLAVTGTPLENSLMDLWSLLSIVAPGLFPSPKRFGELYRKPIESGRSPELLGTLRRRIRPLMLRRTKEAVAADLPPKIEQVLSVPLNGQHRRIYDTHLQRERQRILGLLDDVDKNRIAILTALTRLRQLSLDVHLVEPDAPATVRPSKLDALVEQLVEVVAEGHRCLVFSQFTRFLKVVRERLDAEGIGQVYLDGRTRDRARRVAQFTDGDDPVFLISLKAGGSGLTLTEADYVFVLDPWWNPAVEAQAVDRTHRIGQDSTVMVYRLVAEDTIEEKVVALQERKRELFARVVDEGGLMGAPLSADDIRELVAR